MDKKTHEDYLKETLELALKGQAWVAPNPMVGAILVKDGVVIGKGHHQKYGEAHAEVMAIEEAKRHGYSIEGATLYCSLEPCCHTSKQTPPCAQRIVSEKIRKVFFCTFDPNPSVSGKGKEFLEKNGIEVACGYYEKEAEKINERFFTAMREKRPFIHLKWAQTLDGYIATKSGDSKWISGESSRKKAHELRGLNQAIMVGGSTVLNDNPNLNIRFGLEDEYRSPVKIILGGGRSLRGDEKIFEGEKCLLFFSEERVNSEIVETIREKGHEVFLLKDDDNFSQILSILFEKKIYSVLVEGGSQVFHHFWRHRQFVDKASIFIAPKLLGCGLKAFSVDKTPLLMSEAISSTEVEKQVLGDDVLVELTFEKK